MIILCLCREGRYYDKCLARREIVTETISYITHLECSECGEKLPADREQHLCPSCGGILLTRYDLAELRREVPREQIERRAWNDGLWRYAELLPLSYPGQRVTL